MKFKILNGTPNHTDPSLCFSCSNGHVIQGQTTSNMQVRCLAHISGSPIRISEAIVRCSEYSRRWDTSLRDMKEIAYVLLTKKGKPIGFVSSREAKSKMGSGDADQVDGAQVREVEDDL